MGGLSGRLSAVWGESLLFMLCHALYLWLVTNIRSKSWALGSLRRHFRNELSRQFIKKATTKLLLFSPSPVKKKRI